MGLAIAVYLLKWVLQANVDLKRTIYYKVVTKRAYAMGSNPVWVNNCYYNCDDHIFAIFAVHISKKMLYGDLFFLLIAV